MKDNPLNTVKEALEYYAYNLHISNTLKSCCMEPKSKPYSGRRAEKALEILSTYITRIQSEELVEEVAMELARHYYRGICSAGAHIEGYAEDHVDDFTEEAKAAINTIRGDKPKCPECNDTGLINMTTCCNCMIKKGVR